MTLKSIDLSSIPETTRKTTSRFSEAIVLEAIESLKAGSAVSPDETFKTDGAARRFALELRRRIVEHDDAKFPGHKVSTKTWSSKANTYHCAVLLREVKEAKS